MDFRQASQFQEETVEVIQRTQIVDPPEPQTLEEIVDAIQLTLAECAEDPVPQFEDQTVEVVKTIPQERISKRTGANRRRASAARWDGAATWWW